MKPIRALFLIILLANSVSCKYGGEDDDYNPYQGMSAKQIFQAADKSLANEQFDSAAKQYESLESMYPFSEYAEKAQRNLIYAYYQKGDYPSAAATAERFIHLYPRAKKVDYAYYMKALANFQQTRGTFAPMLKLDESWRDPGTQSQAYSDFATLVQKFPMSRYKANSIQRMIYLRNMFAKRELNTANYYFRRKMYVAAAERASFLIKNYPQAPSARSALTLLYHADRAMGLQKAAEEVAAIYQATYHNVPPKKREG